MRNIKKIVVHCSDSPDDLDIGFKQINEWHKENGWLSLPSEISCGYHYIIRRDGRVETGRPEEERGAHVRGHNSDSIGICWVGRKVISTPQYNSLIKLLKDKYQAFGLEVTDIHGHYELDSKKTCPNLKMPLVRGDVLFVGDETEGD